MFSTSPIWTKLCDWESAIKSPIAAYQFNVWKNHN